MTLNEHMVDWNLQGTIILQHTQGSSTIYHLPLSLALKNCDKNGQSRNVHVLVP